MALRVCFVCSGNICRSPIAEVVLRAMVHEAGLDGRVEVASAGTGAWHLGEPADRRARQVLTARGYDGSAHRARAFDPAWFGERDLLVALDRGHERELRALARTPEDRAKVRLLRSSDPETRGQTLDVADPYYGDDRDFADVLAQVEAACAGLLDDVRGRLP
jgi:protein-tyrosine phosphatase